MSLQDLLQNRALLAAAVTWLVSQAVKPVLFWLTERRWDWRLLFSSGGMPSSHSAGVSALAVSIGISEGLDSGAFAIALVTAIVVFYDAAGVRRATGIQANILNQMLTELFSGDPIAQTRLLELIGHTPFEVVVGAVLGAAIAFALFH